MKYTLKELQAKPTLSSGHFDNVKYDDGHIRVLLSRMTVADGMPYNNQVTIEVRNSTGDWITDWQYEAK